MDDARDLLAFLDAGVTPSHAVAEMARRLAAAGYQALHERDAWALSPGDRRYVVRDGGSVVAFRVGSSLPSDAGFRLV
ncbi:MAG: M18 family aminopeptidase, partial [Euzebyales bacterium]|nr:M18 family aminopeptidase [Euzebyales bacterium]